MAPRTRSLPPELGDVFLAREIAEHGLSRGRSRRTDLDRSVWGTRSTVPVDGDLVRRSRLFQTRLPGAFFSDSTAALLLGAPLPYALEDQPLSMTVPAPARAPHASGIIGHSRVVFPGDVIRFSGLRVGSPARIWCELAAKLDLDDLVAVGDFLISRRRLLTTPGELESRLELGDRITRSPKLRMALALLDGRAESRPESKLRVLMSLAGLPTPEINNTIVLATDGSRLRPDFRFTDHRVIVEYQGDYHRTRDQWRRDLTRRSRLESVGWGVMEINADDLKDPRELCARIRARLTRR